MRRLLQQARASLKNSKRRKAGLRFLQAISADPVRPQSYFLHALHVQKRDPQLTRHLFSHGLRETPNDAKFSSGMGTGRVEVGTLERRP